ncbi:hypothetical protein [Candidatus Wolbachia massiliensis]|uniref:Uncharacterized protein n=1 Tax=Candidatus Wolbachia massiliensis TaxID=1845000 RepID=A0A7L7YL86_9RICK|nr:hypothetical protein [Candidatus Wolbachia massiliensis]QOD37984.1 hypothetical protein ID128_04020 [Candidatus Wolbachia massiliensis]
MSILSVLLFISFSLLNTSNKLVICASLFMGAVLVVNSMVEFYGKKEATHSLIACTVLCCILKWQSLSLMILVSYTAILVSLLLSIVIFEKLKFKVNFHIKNFISLITASVVDTTIVCIGLLYKFSTGKCLSIYIRDLAFKFSYASISSICLLAAAYLFYWAKRKYVKLSV